MSRAATKEWSVSKPFWWLSGRPGHGGLGFDSVCSLMLAGRLNQLWEGCARKPAQSTSGRMLAGRLNRLWAGSL